MKLTRREQLALMGGALTAAAVPAILSAEETAETDGEMMAEGPVTHEVQMLNADPENARERQIYLPAVVRAMPGDTIKFISVDRGHNAQSNEDWSPAGGTEWKSKINDDFEVTIDVEGAYMYECQPHASAGMIGLILVGDVSGNYEDLKGERFRGKARQRAEQYFEIADEMLATEEANAS
ncbi:MAG: plastocyanin/azurin family copper-binding protein [Pseudomonadota bacterium]